MNASNDLGSFDLAARPPGGYRAGDIVAWDLGGGLTHSGILSDRRAAGGAPLVLHDSGRGVQEEDLLLRFRIIGHYRLPGAG